MTTRHGGLKGTKFVSAAERGKPFLPPSSLASRIHQHTNTTTETAPHHHQISRERANQPANQPTSQQQERPARPRKGNTESDHGNNKVTSKAKRQSRSVVVAVARPGRTHTKKSCGHTHTHTPSLWTHGPCPSHGIIIPQVPFAPRADEWAQPWSSTESGEWSWWWWCWWKENQRLTNEHTHTGRGPSLRGCVGDTPNLSSTAESSIPVDHITVKYIFWSAR